jgi:hypothetical protein
MTGENESLHGEDHCSDCLSLFEIVTIDLSFFRRSWMLFVCLNCGTMKADDIVEADRFRNRAASFLAGIKFSPVRAKPISQRL